LRKVYAWSLRNSFAVCMAVALAGFTAIVFGSLSYTVTQQMAMIMAVFYGLCRMYQSYRRHFDKDYSLLGKHDLEILFLSLGIFAVGVGIYIDACSVMRP